MKKHLTLLAVAGIGLAITSGCRTDTTLTPHASAFSTTNSILWSKTSGRPLVSPRKSTDGLGPSLMIACDDTGYCAEDQEPAPYNDTCWEDTHAYCSTGAVVEEYIEPGEAAGVESTHIHGG